MVTYNDVTEVVRNRCVNHQTKRVNSKAILHLIETFVGAEILQAQILLIKQTH